MPFDLGEVDAVEEAEVVEGEEQALVNGAPEVEYGGPAALKPMEDDLAAGAVGGGGEAQQQGGPQVGQPALIAGGPLGAEPGAEAQAEVLPAALLADEIQNSGAAPAGALGETEASAWKAVPQRSSDKNRGSLHHPGQSDSNQAELAVDRNNRTG